METLTQWEVGSGKWGVGSHCYNTREDHTTTMPDWGVTTTALKRLRRGVRAHRDVSSTSTNTSTSTATGTDNDQPKA